MLLTSPFKFATAAEPKSHEIRTLDNEAVVNNQILLLYNQLDFGSYSRLSYDVFNKAFRGFINLRKAGKLNAQRDIITICDFSLSSTQKRLWIIDLKKKKVLFNTYVAHGQGSGAEFPTAFSNNNNSHQSSLGFFVTGETYNGSHGISLHLAGMDDGYNDAARDREIVVHGADYVSERFIKEKKYLGRSWGCPAIPTNLTLPIINTIKEGTCLFIYYPHKQYLQTSGWINRKIPFGSMG
jgi:hypothetical protein